MNKYLSRAKTIVRIASLYNASALVFFLIPDGLELFGIAEPYSSFWRVLPALLASYVAIVLWLSSADILKYASFPFWNGLIRIVFAVVALAANYQVSVGIFIFWLALGDFLIGALCLWIMKVATGRSFAKLLTNNPSI